MMYSDYFALSACAFSILYVPFLIIAQLRFTHIMQNEGYDNKRYFTWIGKNFMLAYFPLIGICILSLMAELALGAYLRHTTFYEMQVILGYVFAVMIISVLIAWVFYKYIKCIKIESEVTPIICSKHLINVFIVSSFMVCGITVVENIFTEIDKLVFFIPLITPLFVPLANAVTKRKAEA